MSDHFSYYDGVLAFKQWQWKEDPFGKDWADLSDQERADWARVQRLELDRENDK